MTQDQERADLGFGDALDDLDLATFAPEPAKKKRAPKSDVADKAAEAAGFKSREPKQAQVEAEPKGQGREEEVPTPQRRRRTGRNAQFNLKAKPETIEAYCNIADANDWGLGETLEKAVELLQERYS